MLRQTPAPGKRVPRLRAGLGAPLMLTLLLKKEVIRRVLSTEDSYEDQPRRCRLKSPKHKHTSYFSGDGDALLQKRENGPRKTED